MAPPKETPIAAHDNGSVMPDAHDDNILVSFTDPAKKNKPRNHTLVDVPELRAKFQVLDDELEHAAAIRASVVQDAQDAYDALAKDIAKRRAVVNTEAFKAARAAVTKQEKQAAKAAAIAAVDIEE